MSFGLAIVHRLVKVRAGESWRANGLPGDYHSNFREAGEAGRDRELRYYVRDKMTVHGI
jgi:hypothetical protein